MIRIEIVDDVREKMKKDRELIEKIAKGKAKMPKHRRVLSMTPKIFAKVFSPQRLKLINTIRDNHLKSISELARKVQRKFEAVHRDCKLFEKHGIVCFEKVGKNNVPTLCDKIELVIA